MSDKNLTSALAYYQALNDKDLTTAEKYLHPNVKLISPLATVTGKAAVLDSLVGFTKVCNKVVIRAQFNSGNQVMLALNAEFVAPIGTLRTAVLMQFKDGLIHSNELFYDGKQVAVQKDTIFAQS